MRNEHVEHGSPTGRHDDDVDVIDAVIGEVITDARSPAGVIGSRTRDKIAERESRTQQTVVYALVAVVVGVTLVTLINCVRLPPAQSMKQIGQLIDRIIALGLGGVLGANFRSKNPPPS